MTEPRQLLRELPVFAGDLPAFDPVDTPGEPAGLFTTRLLAASPLTRPPGAGTGPGGGAVTPGWTLHTVRAESVEFPQGDRDRKHTRPAYRRTAGHWTKELLWT
ncbi:pyridoxine 5'-phosphate oxidase C-terminal domain-containing protein [Streptomyces lydicus]|uniref:pyridoxine 5'-phosphate oxidase C-terminal domain-containing protein n=1 Tax=Streptomyces lydicus TaxID=47763 RepID=UPI0036C64E54